VDGGTALGAFLAWAVIFAILYAQSPLYTSNQKTVFSAWMARAGLGFLNRDWAGRHAGSYPVFSALIYLTYALTHSDLLFYVYYALLMGVYLFSVYGLMDLLFDLRSSKTRSLLFVTLFLGAHSAALALLTLQNGGIRGYLYGGGGVAGQRLLGQVLPAEHLRSSSWCFPFIYFWRIGGTGRSWRWLWPSRFIRLICWARPSNLGLPVGDLS